MLSMMQWVMMPMKKKGKRIFESVRYTRIGFYYFFPKLPSDQIVTQVLDELGLQLNDQLSGLNPASTSLSTSNKTAVSTAAGAAGGGNLPDADADLQARLDNLRRE